MNGSQLRVWRKAHDLSMQQIADELLKGEVSQSTVSRWESDQADIPKWAEEKILGTTKIELEINELHELLDLARDENISFDQLLGDCIREHLARRRSRQSTANILPIIQPVIEHQRVAETAARGYTAPFSASLTAPTTAPHVDPIGAALRAAAAQHLAGPATSAPPQPHGTQPQHPSAPPPPPKPAKPSAAKP